MQAKDKIRLVALGKEPADLLLKNGKIVDVLTETVYEGDVAIACGVIAGIGSYNDGKRVIDVQGGYIAPGLINTHVHVESSMATPENYCAEELQWGVTTVITDPHEIANVAGADGVRYMLNASRNLPINYYVELPSCVPATPFEHAGCVMDAAAMAPLSNLDGVLGLGEVMDVPAVLNGSADMQAKLALFAGRVIDGHFTGEGGAELQAYAGSGVSTDHESISWAQAKAKLRAGINVLAREGSACRNLKAIISGVLAENFDVSCLAFCTDDKHLADLRREGSIRHCVQLAVELGMEPVRALRIGSINAARIYGLRRLGAIAPGYQADIVVFDDLHNLQPRLVLHKGEDALAKINSCRHLEPPAKLRGSVNPAPFTAADFSPEKFLPGQTYPVIEMLPGEVVTEKGSIRGEDVAAALTRGELCLIAVLERHHATGFKGLGLLQGYGLQNGAVATTVAHDSHNLIVVGTSAADMEIAARELLRVQGGYTLVRGGEVIDTLPLGICGLMSDKPAAELIEDVERICALAYAQGVVPTADPFITISFMALPVIPRLRITDMGMFDVDKFAFCE